MNIIADVGSNWTTLEQAQRMIGSLAELGITLVKFQLFTADMVPEEYKTKVIDEKMATQLFEHGRDLGVDVFFTPMYLEAVEICEKIGVKRYKIRYADKDNIELIRKCRATEKPMLISGKDLYCIPKYPATVDDYLPIPLGYKGISDHTPDLTLFGLCQDYEYFEIHVKEDNKCLESEWSKSIEELKNVLD